MTRTRASEDQLQTLLRISHFLWEQTLIIKNYVVSWPLLFQNTYNSGSFLPDLKGPEGKLEHTPLLPGWKSLKPCYEKISNNQHQCVSSPGQTLLITGMQYVTDQVIYIYWPSFYKSANLSILYYTYNFYV